MARAARTPESSSGPHRSALVDLLNGRLYRGRAHDVLVVDCRALVEEHGSDILLSPINSGATMYKVRPRGSTTLLPIFGNVWGVPEGPGRKNAVAEVAVQYGVSDISDVLVRVERRRGNEVEAVLWERGRCDADTVEAASSPEGG